MLDLEIATDNEIQVFEKWGALGELFGTLQCYCGCLSRSALVLDRVCPVIKIFLPFIPISLFIVIDISSGIGILLEFHSCYFQLVSVHCVNTLPVSRNFSTNVSVVHCSLQWLTLRIHVRSNFCVKTCTLYRCGIFIPNGKMFHNSSGVGTFLALFPPFNLWTETKKIKTSLWDLWDLSTVHVPLEWWCYVFRLQ